ncbi:MAG: cupredoxin domain-containing protein [Actinomycetota bacterium]
MLSLRERFESNWSRGAVGVVIGLLGLTLLAACSQSSEPSGEVGTGSAPGEAIDIAIDDSTFHPEVVEAPAGEEVTVEVTNNDGMPHDFAIESLDLNTGTIESDGSAYATFTVGDEPIEFVCTFHSDMKGRIEPQ